MIEMLETNLHTKMKINDGGDIFITDILIKGNEITAKEKNSNWEKLLKSARSLIEDIKIEVRLTIFKQTSKNKEVNYD